METDQELVPNCFQWQEGTPAFWSGKEFQKIDYQHDVWGITPRNIYQNLALELMTKSEIDLVSIQSEAGYGKTYLALAAALYLSLERKDIQIKKASKLKTPGDQKASRRISTNQNLRVNATSGSVLHEALLR